MKPATLKPEHWAVDAGDAPQAVLTIPADSKRERRFEISCAMTVALSGAANEASASAWHQMTVQADGAQQWQRRVPTQNPGAWDGLDYRFTRTVPVGRGLRLVVSVACLGVRRRSLKIEAEEI